MTTNSINPNGNVTELAVTLRALAIENQAAALKREHRLVEERRAQEAQRRQEALAEAIDEVNKIAQDLTFAKIHEHMKRTGEVGYIHTLDRHALDTIRNVVKGKAGYSGRLSELPWVIHNTQNDLRPLLEALDAAGFVYVFDDGVRFVDRPGSSDPDSYDVEYDDPKIRIWFSA